MMVASAATRVRSKKDKVPTIEVLAARMVEDVLESSQMNLRSVGQCPLEREAYFRVDAFKNFMTSMTNNILRQVTEQVKRAMEAVNAIKPLPTFDYVPTTECELSHRCAPLGRRVEVLM